MVEVPDVIINENAPEGASFEEIYQFVTREVPARMVYQYAILDKVAVFGEGSNRPVSNAMAARDRRGGGATLDRSDNFRRMIDAFESNGGSSESHAFGYVRFDYMHNLGELGNAPEQLQAKAVWNARGFQFAGGQLRFDGEGDIVADFYLGYDERADGLPALLRRLGSLPEDAFGAVAGDAHGASALEFDLAGAARDIIALVERTDPRAQATLQMIQQQSRAVAGIDAFDDLLFLIGGTHLVLEDKPEDPDSQAAFRRNPLAGFEDATFALGVSDSVRVSNSLATLAEKLVQMTGQDVVETQRFEGADVHLALAEPGGEPLLALAGASGYLILGNQPDGVKRFIRSASGGAERPLSRDREFRRLARRAPADACFVSFEREIALTPLEVSSMGELALSIVSQFRLVSPEMMRSAYTAYSEQPYNEKALFLPASQFTYARRGEGFLHARAAAIARDRN